MKGGSVLIIRPQIVVVRWSGANRSWYENKGYVWTKKDDKFKVDIENVQLKSQVEVVAKCDLCGETFERSFKRLNAKKHHFCSDKCVKSFKEKEYSECRIKTYCEYCNKEYTVTKSQFNKYGSRFCSMNCRNKWESENKKGENHHNFNSILMNCDNCKEEFYVKKHKLEIHNNFFCCNECRQEWYANVWSQNEEWKEESRKRAVRLLQNNDVNVNTSPQIQINNVLDKLNIKYVNEYDCIYYSVDNYLTEHNLMIEVMGTYWHSDPRFYDEINYEMQVNRIIKDKAKNTFLTKNLNYKVLYVWENDIDNNMNMIEKLIELFINSNGNISNFHSFNYNINDNSIRLNKNLIIPFMEYDKHDLNINYLTEPKSRKQKDKWITFNCDYCGKEKEQLISHYDKNKTHCCSSICSTKLNNRFISK